MVRRPSILAAMWPQAAEPKPTRGSAQLHLAEPRAMPVFRAGSGPQPHCCGHDRYGVDRRRTEPNPVKELLMFKTLTIAFAGLMFIAPALAQGTDNSKARAGQTLNSEVTMTHLEASPNAGQPRSAHHNSEKSRIRHGAPPRHLKQMKHIAHSKTASSKAGATRTQSKPATEPTAN
jgi:hypothetical protein